MYGHSGCGPLALRPSLESLCTPQDIRRITSRADSLSWSRARVWQPLLSSLCLSLTQCHTFFSRVVMHMHMRTRAPPGPAHTQCSPRSPLSGRRPVGRLRPLRCRLRLVGVGVRLGVSVGSRARGRVAVMAAGRPPARRPPLLAARRPRHAPRPRGGAHPTASRP